MQNQNVYFRAVSKADFDGLDCSVKGVEACESFGIRLKDILEAEI